MPFSSWSPSCVLRSRCGSTSFLSRFLPDLRFSPLTDAKMWTNVPAEGDSISMILGMVNIGPWKCPGCASNKIQMNGRHSKLLYDLRFTAGGIKRWISKYIIDHYKCRTCGTPFASAVYDLTRHRYGLQLLAYVIYNIIGLHIPQLKLSGSMFKLFGYQVGQPTINGLKRRAAELYQDAYEEIKHMLAH